LILNVVKAQQSISFPIVPDKSAGESSIILEATATSGLPVVFEVLNGPAVLDGDALDLVGAGTVTVSAWQAGDTNYLAAAPVRRTFKVSKIPQTISFGGLSWQILGDAPFPLVATTSSGLPVSFRILSGPALLSGNIVTVTGSGTVVVRATQLGNAVHASAADVDQSFMVALGLNLITDAGLDADGTFCFTFMGEFGRQYVIELSTDLSNWAPVATNTVDALGNLQFKDAAAMNRPPSFFRVVSQ